jgi:FkbM family methyltransferase
MVKLPSRWRMIPPVFQDAIRIIDGSESDRSRIVMVDPIIKSYGQYNEDLIIDAILGCKKEGFYVDVGANHPNVLSNTKRFYDRGWHGVNIEPNPLMFALLQKERKNDVNLNIGLGKENGEIEFYLLDPDTLSTFSKSSAIRMTKQPEYKIVSVSKVKVMSLKEVLETHASGKQIDFMSIDVEGFEAEVIGGGDWEKFRPHLIMMEINQKGETTVEMLKKVDYRLVFANGTNGIFLDNRSICK